MEVAPFFVDFHHFLSIFTIFYRFSRFTHFCRNLHFVAIYALFPQFFLAKIAFSATSHVFCMYGCKLQTWKCKEWFTSVSSKLGLEKYFYSWADFLHDMNTKLSHSWQKQLRIWFNKAIKKSEEKGGSKRRPENIRQKLVKNLVTVILLPASAPFANVRIFMVSSCSKVCSLNS